MPLRQTALADATGLIITVHISRVPKALRNGNLITFERRQLGIHDWRHLYDAAEFDPTYLHLKSFER